LHLMPGARWSCLGKFSLTHPFPDILFPTHTYFFPVFWVSATLLYGPLLHFTIDSLHLWHTHTHTHTHIHTHTHTYIHTHTHTHTLSLSLSLSSGLGLVTLSMLTLLPVLPLDLYLVLLPNSRKPCEHGNL
jgi:hypothetical protein